MTVATIEPNAADSIQRFKSGRRAFGSKIEDRFVACSVGAIANAHCGPMQFLEGGDTFFTKWPVGLIPVTDLKQMDEVAYEKLNELTWHVIDWRGMPWSLHMVLIHGKMFFVFCFYHGMIRIGPVGLNTNHRQKQFLISAFHRGGAQGHLACLGLGTQLRRAQLLGYQGEKIRVERSPQG